VHSPHRTSLIMDVQRYGPGSQEVGRPKRFARVPETGGAAGLFVSRALPTRGHDGPRVSNRIRRVAPEHEFLIAGEPLTAFQVAALAGREAPTSDPASAYHHCTLAERFGSVRCSPPAWAPGCGSQTGTSGR
jgi:hypothetical protein